MYFRSALKLPPATRHVQCCPKSVYRLFILNFFDTSPPRPGYRKSDHKFILSSDLEIMYSFKEIPYHPKAFTCLVPWSVKSYELMENFSTQISQSVLLGTAHKCERPGDMRKILVATREKLNKAHSPAALWVRKVGDACVSIWDPCPANNVRIMYGCIFVHTL